MRFGLSALVLGAALLLGGGTHRGFAGDVAVQLLAVPLLILGTRDWIATMAKDERWRADHRLLNLALIAAIIFIVLQIVLSPVGGNMLSNISGLYLSGWPGEAPPPARWNGLAAASWAAIASSIPFFAVFLGGSHLHQRDREKLAMLVVMFGGLNLLIGFLQVSHGGDSNLRFYAITNPSEAVGLFANRNHFAALLYITLTLTAMLLAGLGDVSFRTVRLNIRQALGLFLAAMIFIAVLSGIAWARSRAGMALGMAATLGIAGLYWMPSLFTKRNARHSAPPARRFLIAVGVFGLLFSIQYGMQRGMSRFDVDPFSDLRASLSPKTAALAVQNLPFGAGLGSFEQAYAVSEADADLFAGYANRAHNDWAEFLLETGIPGAIAGGLFLMWLAKQAMTAWWKRRKDKDNCISIFEKGASLIIVLLLAHSLVDYPLRTTALSAIFAFAAVLLVRPPDSGNILPSGGIRRRRVQS